MVEDALARGVDDWIHVAEFVNIAERTGLSDAEGIRAITIGVIAEVISAGLMIAGDVGRHGFHAWDLSPADQIVRIVQTWDATELYPTPGAVAWLANTPEGDRLGRSVLRREGSEP